MSRLLGRLLTQSFPGKRTGLSDSAPAVVGEDSTTTDSYTSRGLDLWLESLRNRETARILDLGILRSANLVYCSARGWDMGIVGYSRGSLVDHCRRFSHDEPFDAVLCWDIPNYCESDDEFAELGQWLGGVLRHGAPILLSLATRTPYDDAPAQYEMVADNRIRFTRTSGESSRSTIFAQSRLGRLWPDFFSDRSFLLRSGWQEHVLHRRGKED